MDKKSLELFKKAKAALAEETKNAENAGYSKTAEKRKMRARTNIRNCRAVAFFSVRTTFFA